MAHVGLLVLSQPLKFSRILPTVQERLLNTLYVHIPNSFLSAPIERILYSIYSQANFSRSNLDIRVLLSGFKSPELPVICTGKKIELVLFDNNFSNTEMNNFIHSRVMTTVPNCRVISLRKGSDDCESTSLETFIKGQKCNLKLYNNVVLGGTFDRLHCGHKILLSEAVLHCSGKLTVGVTDTSMLKDKKLWELIEPVERRMSHVEEFLKDVDSTLNYEIVPIYDPFGPTKDDPFIQMIVVSRETLKGGNKVNELRAKSGLSILDIHVVDLLTNEDFPHKLDIEEDKISSSNDRLRLLGTRLRIPKAKDDLPRHPYIIGFTGGIASGKSTMCQRIAKLGAGVIDCDQLAHKLYNKGDICHQLIVENFGEDILDLEGRVDRKKLASIVFQDKEKRKLLNSILWPRILERAKEESIRLYKNGYKIVLWEAALLLEAGWEKHCHEVWLCIVSPQEAVRRLEARNGLTTEEAKARLAAQTSNEELVPHAHVVFSTEWDEKFSQSQVEMAWNHLQDFLKTQDYQLSPTP